VTEDFPKPRYEPPSTIDLGRMAKGSGACSGGMSDTGTCTQGDAATVDCTAGLAASGTTCSAGNFNVPGGCTGGGSPT
jgi:hypothetical protein